MMLLQPALVFSRYMLSGSWKKPPTGLYCDFIQYQDRP